jgi:serine/threonine protein kinase
MLNPINHYSIVYRDLKPDNIGFDVRGDVKIFDFGLSRQLPSEKLEGGTYKMTGDTGSPRYMAPEIALEQPYNETVDAYSFGILLYQMCALETPFEGYTMKMFEKKVVSGGSRPKVDPKWPARIQTLLHKCWNVQISQRPSMQEVVDTLREEITENTDNEVLDILDASNKTQHSLHMYQKGKN